MASAVSSASSGPPEPSALTTLIAHSGAKSAVEALPLEILHNLRYQHSWTDLQLHTINLGLPRSSSPSPSSSGTSTPTQRSLNTSGSISGSPSTSQSPSNSGSSMTLISGLPQRPSYIHPDLQAQLLRHRKTLADAEAAVPTQREFVIPTVTSAPWTLSRFAALFDSLPERDLIVIPPAAGGAGKPLEWRDAKRVLLAIKEGKGEGTIVYYLMQEGEVKPRQNG